MHSILIIEDDSVFAGILKKFLEKNEYKCQSVASLKSGRSLLQSHAFDLVLLDLNLPDGNGLDLLDFIRNQPSQRWKVIIMTSFHDVRTAVKSLKSGAYEYITKPVNPEELLMIINELSWDAPDASTTERENKLDMILGSSEASRLMMTHIHLVAQTNLTVLLEGKSGTGKEKAAQYIHQLSSRSERPFVAVDCGVLHNETANSELFGHVKGAFTGATQDKVGHLQFANGGTLFLDEIGNLNYEIQVKLLRALQERIIQPMGSNKPQKVDLRIIAATNEDLRNAISSGNFREDLYHRLNEFKMQVPSLSERREDLPELLHHFMAQANKELNKSVLHVDDKVMHLFHQYDWPGNIRELRSTIKRAVLLSKENTLTLDSLPAEMAFSIPSKENKKPSDLKTLKSSLEKDLLLETLERVNYNKSEAARILKIDRSTLYNKLLTYNISGQNRRRNTS